MKDNKLKPKSKFNILISESTVKSFSQLHDYLKDVYQVDKKTKGHYLVRVAWKYLCKNQTDESARKEALETLHQIITNQGLKLDKVFVKGRTVVSFNEEEATSIQSLIKDLTVLAEDEVHWLSRHGYNVPNADSFIHGLIVYLQAQLKQEQQLPLTQRAIIKDILLVSETKEKNVNLICF